MSVQFKDVPASKLEESYATAPGPVRGEEASDAKARPSSAKSHDPSSPSKSTSMDRYYDNAAEKQKQRPNTANVTSSKTMDDHDFSVNRPRSAATAPNFGGQQQLGDSRFASEASEPCDKRLRSSTQNCYSWLPPLLN